MEANDTFFSTGRLRYEIIITNLDDDSAEVNTFSTQDVSFTVQNLTPGTAYEIQIQTIGMQRRKNSEVISVLRSSGIT